MSFFKLFHFGRNSSYRFGIFNGALLDKSSETCHTRQKCISQKIPAANREMGVYRNKNICLNKEINRIAVSTARRSSANVKDAVHAPPLLQPDTLSERQLFQTRILFHAFAIGPYNGLPESIFAHKLQLHRHGFAD